MTDERLYYLLEQKHRNALTAPEQAELDNWYKQQLDAAPSLFNEDAGLEYKRAQFADILQNIEEKESYTPRFLPMKKYWMAAATIALLIVAGVYIFGMYNAGSGSLVTKQETAGNIKLKRFRNTTTENISMFLDDSSKVVLYPGSILEVLTPFNESRSLKLQGKAFFEVAKMPGNPFIVHTHDISTTALGTSFTIAAFDSSDTVNVVLHDGKVLVKYENTAESRSYYLSPGDRICMNANSQSPEARFTKNTIDTTKRTGKLADNDVKTGVSAVFDQMPLNKVLDSIAKAYQVNISYRTVDVKNMNFTGEITQHHTLGNVLYRIAILNKLTIRRTGNGYLITKK